MLRVKIVCTIGPASRSPDILARLIEAGMNVARLNMSHGSHADHAADINRIRTISQELKRSVAVLADLQGPKLRVGVMQEGGVPLEDGDEILLTTGDEIGVPGRIPIQNAELPPMVQAGERILLDDGLLELEVIETTEDTIRTRVIVGGQLHDRKGMNLPHTKLVIPSLTDKDREDAAFAIEQQVDWIALSFVRTAQDVHDLRTLIQGRSAFGRTTPIISKIEKPEAVQNIEEILQASDGIMIARGDLGIETSPEAVPMVQKMIIASCNATDRPVITATQMLDSMIRNPRPTRAEASDVANAVLDGSDAIMLSGETATGQYPVRSVQTMVKIAEEAERVRHLNQGEIVVSSGKVDTIAGAVSHATVVTARELKAAAIITPTVSGATAKKLARFRPSVPIIAVTPSPLVYRQLALFWGVFPLMGRRMNSTDEVVEDAVRITLHQGYVDQGDVVVVTGGVVGGVPGATNLMTVRRIARIIVNGRGLGQKRISGHIVRLKPKQNVSKLQVTANDILVAEKLDQSFAELVHAAGGLITKEAGLESFATLAASELGIPAIIGARGHWQELKDGISVVLDAKTGNVYEWER